MSPRSFVIHHPCHGQVLLSSGAGSMSLTVRLLERCSGMSPEGIIPIRLAFFCWFLCPYNLIYVLLLGVWMNPDNFSLWNCAESPMFKIPGVACQCHATLFPCGATRWLGYSHYQDFSIAGMLGEARVQRWKRLSQGDSFPLRLPIHYLQHLYWGLEQWWSEGWTHPGTGPLGLWCFTWALGKRGPKVVGHLHRGYCRENFCILVGFQNGSCLPVVEASSVRAS